MKALDVMTTAIISVKPETPVHEIAALMTEKRVSGLPVLGADGALLGIVSQSDLLHRKEIGTEPKHKWWLRVFSDSDRLAREYSKAHGLRAHDVMTRHVISIQEDAELSDVAALLDRNRVKRVPVLRNGKLVGLITRTDLVKALKSAPAPSRALETSDDALQRTLADKARQQPWLNASYLNVVVDKGAVQLWGFVNSADQRQALRILVEETAGVKKVDDRLTIGSPIIGAI